MANFCCEDIVASQIYHRVLHPDLTIFGVVCEGISMFLLSSWLRSSIVLGFCSRESAGGAAEPADRRLPGLSLQTAGASVRKNTTVPSFLVTKCAFVIHMVGLL